MNALFRVVLKAVLLLGMSSSALGAQADRLKPTQEAAILNLNFCRPIYPQEAMRSGQQGVVKMQFTIGVTGRLVGASIVKSSGYKELDMAALEALIHCSFRPAYRNDVPMQSTFSMEYKWVLDQQ